MLLFTDNSQQSDGNERQVLVVTPDPSMMALVCEQLEIRGIGLIKRFANNIEQLDTLEDIAGIDCIIFDASRLESPDAVIELIDLQLSRSVVKVAFSTKDSLVIADNFLKKGIEYCHFPTQINRIGSFVLQQQKQSTTTGHAIRITLLGCKGGIGTSVLSYHAAEYLARKRQSSTLIVQGSRGSRNLDLISKVAITNEVTLLQNNLYAFYEDHTQPWLYNNPLYEQHECIIFDFTGHNAADENIENILTHSDCLLLICDRNLSSVRTAKKIIEANNHLMNSDNGLRRIYICHNQHHSKVNGEISTQELSGLLGKPVDISIPYLLKSGDPSLPLNFSGKNNIYLEKLCNLLLGRRQTDGKKHGLFDSLKQLTERK